jgi:type IV pilus assembly protein PilE
MSKYMRGLTLIELMVVVAIMAILATVAMVSWGNYVRRAARSDAMATLQDLAVKQEQYRLTRPSYAAAVTEASLVAMFPVVANINASSTRKYDLAIRCGNVARFTATAVPRAGTSQANDECGTFAISQDGPSYQIDSNCDGAADVTTGVADAQCWKR